MLHLEQMMLLYHCHRTYAYLFLKLVTKLLSATDKLPYDDKLQMQTLHQQGFDAKVVIAKCAHKGSTAFFKACEF